MNDMSFHHIQASVEEIAEPGKVSDCDTGTEMEKGIEEQTTDTTRERIKD